MSITQNTRLPLSLIIAIGGGIISLCGVYYAIQADVTKTNVRIDNIELRNDLEIKARLTELAEANKVNTLAMKTLTERLDAQDVLQRDIWRDVRALRGIREGNRDNKP